MNEIMCDDILDYYFGNSVIRLANIGELENGGVAGISIKHLLETVVLN